MNDKHPPTDEHIVLVAFHIKAPTMKEAQISLMRDHLDSLPEDPASVVESWWIAMDERYQSSDEDSAEFVNNTGRRALNRFRTQQGADLVMIQNYVFEAKDDAEEVIIQANRLMDRYGYVTVNDMLDLLGIPTTYRGESLAWTSHLPEGCVRENEAFEDMWRLDLPTPDASSSPAKKATP